MFEITSHDGSNSSVDICVHYHPRHPASTPAKDTFTTVFIGDTDRAADTCFYKYQRVCSWIMRFYSCISLLSDIITDFVRDSILATWLQEKWDMVPRET